jgi:hypothetical protein
VVTFAQPTTEVRPPILLELGGRKREAITVSVRISLIAAVLVFAAASASAQNATQAGTFVVEHPTLLNLGFEWSIRGDANRNASVDVQFRAAGEAVWRKGLPLARIGGERVFRQRENLRQVRRWHKEHIYLLIITACACRWVPSLRNSEWADSYGFTKTSRLVMRPTGRLREPSMTSLPSFRL